MPLRFDVDGKKTENPGPEDISHGFSSIDATGMRSLSVVFLERGSLKLFAFGHPKEGYTLEINEDRSRKVTSLKKLVPQTDVIGLFQAFARGDDSWQGRCEWERLEDIPTTAANLFSCIAYLSILAALVLLLKYLLKLL